MNERKKTKGKIEKKRGIVKVMEREEAFLQVS
jgi:hypothetical protein